MDNEVRASWPRAEAEALLQAAEDGLLIILALNLVRVTSTTEHAVETLQAPVARRGANVSATFGKVEAAALDRAADIGLRVIFEFPLERDHDAARQGLAELRAVTPAS